MRATLASNEQETWKGQGSNLAEGMSQKQFRKAAGLDWKVERSPVNFRLLMVTG